ncbi:hypothetical protein K1719_018855 [Acacia pycnantha]|nr:hypothetical protein K1719_018855 [Acacia pycnantha]
MMKCLAADEAQYVLMEIHEGINGHHMGAKALARKAVRAGYFWPTLAANAKTHVQKCDNCQRHVSTIKAPPATLQTISAPWPFFKWGMDLLGPFKRAVGQLRWLIVAVDYFTKWIEAIAIELDLVDEVRIAAHCRDLAAKQLISTRYNKKVRPRGFDKGSLVLRRADIGNKNASEGKLAPNWEGPYRVTESTGKGAYKLETLQKKAVKRTWNADKLKAYYS